MRNCTFTRAVFSNMNNRYVKKIKNKQPENIDIIILTAGIGSKIKSYEPRSLIRMNDKSLLEHQIDAFSDKLLNCNFITVIGYEANKIIRKFQGKTRIVENLNFNESNNGESLRLGVNNGLSDNVLFMHGDIYFDKSIIDEFIYTDSFIITSNGLEEREVGVTVTDGYVNTFSYGLEKKWGQIAFLKQKDLEILRKLIIRNDFNTKFMLTFEVLNKLIELGVRFKEIEVDNKKIKEIDTVKDISYENFN